MDGMGREGRAGWTRWMGEGFLAELAGTVVLAVLVLALLSLAACSGSPTDVREGVDPITELPRALTAEEVELLTSANRFGFDLLRVLAPGHASDNLFFSPLSASMALGMTLNGADGETYAQMRDMLGFQGMEQDEINGAYATLVALLQELDPTVTVEIANSVWHREGVGVDAAFLARVRDAFDAEVAGVDFGDPGTLQRINGWVDERTHGTIEKLVDELPPNLVMLLLNAVYFNGEWTQAFDPDRTASGPFVRSDGTEVTADFMHAPEAAVRLGSTGGGHQVLELPYGGGAFVMDVVLPAEGTRAAELAATVDEATWSAWTGALAEAEADVWLPKLELEWTRTLNDDLRALGMRDAFDAGAADFSRMIPGGGVWVDQVLQKSFVRVDEVGTEAAAVTGVFVVESAGPSFRADRPFLFAIRERLSGTVLFLGVVDDPS